MKITRGFFQHRFHAIRVVILGCVDVAWIRQWGDDLLLLRLWVQDGDPSQNSAMARAAMDRANCQLLKILPRSPDLNPIENMFKLVSDALRKQAITSQITTETYEQSKDRVISIIKSIPREVVNKTIASMANRVDEIIKRKGERLRY